MTDACIAYINKLKAFGDTMAPGELFISARNKAYGTNYYANTTYVVDNVRKDHYPDRSLPPTTNALLEVGVPDAAILYADAEETLEHPAPHILSASNVCGYVSWGAHSTLGNEYSRPGTNHLEVKWTGDSSWWIIQAVESYNGMPYCGHGDYFMWFSSDAFGGTDYSNTPVGAITHPDEPYWWNRPNKYFQLWEIGSSFVSCAWNSLPPGQFQAVGDPFVKR